MGKYLNLVHVRRPHFGKLFQLIDMLDAKVANTDTLRLPLIVQPLQSLPHLLTTCLPAVWRVDKKQVNVARVGV